MSLKHMTEGNGVRVRVNPASLDAPPGAKVELSVDVYNSTDVIDGFDLAVVGLDQKESVEYQPKDISLFPDTEEHIGVKVTIPETYSDGNHTLVLRVTSKTNPEVYSYQEISLNVAAAAEATMKVDPDKLTAGRKGRYAVTVRNEGGADFDARLSGDDPENHLDFDFNKQVLTVDGGKQVSSQMTVTGRRPLAGDPATRLVKVIATSGETTLEQTVTLVQRPWIPRVVITLGLVLGLLGVWAVIVGAAIDKILDDTDTDLAASITKGVDDVLDELGPATGAAAGGAATDIGGTVGPVPEGEGGVVRGRVVVFSDKPDDDMVPIPGATVAAFPLDSSDKIDELRDPIVGITNDAGSYKIADMGRGRYILKVSAPGYEPIWIGENTPTYKELIPEYGSHAMLPLNFKKFADKLDIPWSGTRRNVALIATPGMVSGSVATAEDNAGTTIQIARVDDSGLATLATVIFTVVTGESGTFLFPCAPEAEPAAAGADASCSPPPLAPAGTVTVADVEIPKPQPRELQPGTYLMTFSKAGFVSQQLTTEITPGSELPGTDIVLVAEEAAGSFSAFGTITSDGKGLAGVAVEVSGASSVKTVTDADGKYRFSVDTPGVYSVTFSKPGYMSVAREVTIDESDKPKEITPPVVMAAEPIMVTGRVLNQNGVALEGVTVFTSTDPGWCPTEDMEDAVQSGAGGTFLLPDVGPGRGTLCFTRTGYEPAWAAYIAVPGQNIENLEIVMYELVVVTGQVTISGITENSLEGVDQASFVVLQDETSCDQPGSSYQSVVFSGSILTRVEVLVSITEDPLATDPLSTALRLWDPAAPQSAIAELTEDIARTDAEGLFPYDLDPDTTVVPGRVYIIEWASNSTEARWVRSASDEDPYPTGRSIACEPTGPPPIELNSAQDYAFVAHTAIGPGLAGATINVDGMEQTVSAASGTFQMTVASGPRVITVTHPGYESTVINKDFVAGDATTLSDVQLPLVGKAGSLQGAINCGEPCVEVLNVSVNGVAVDPVAVDPTTGAFTINDIAAPARITLTTTDPPLNSSYIVDAGEDKNVGEIWRLFV